jgi:hypothetical protein
MMSDEEFFYSRKSLKMGANRFEGKKGKDWRRMVGENEGGRERRSAEIDKPPLTIKRQMGEKEEGNIKMGGGGRVHPHLHSLLPCSMEILLLFAVFPLCLPIPMHSSPHFVSQGLLACV